MAADHYAALRVARGASPAEVRAAFTARCRALHPDAGGRAAGDELARVVEAFRVLRDPAARAAYDAGAAGGGAAWRPEDYELRRRAAAFRRAHLRECVGVVGLSLLARGCGRGAAGRTLSAAALDRGPLP